MVKRISTDLVTGNETEWEDGKPPRAPTTGGIYDDVALHLKHPPKPAPPEDRTISPMSDETMLKMGFFTGNIQNAVRGKVVRLTDRQSGKAVIIDGRGESIVCRAAEEGDEGMADVEGVV